MKAPQAVPPGSDFLTQTLCGNRSRKECVRHLGMECMCAWERTCTQTNKRLNAVVLTPRHCLLLLIHSSISSSSRHHRPRVSDVLDYWQDEQDEKGQGLSKNVTQGKGEGGAKGCWFAFLGRMELSLIENGNQGQVCIGRGWIRRWVGSTCTELSGISQYRRSLGS